MGMLHPDYQVPLEVLEETRTQVTKYNQTLKEWNYIYLGVNFESHYCNVWIHQDYFNTVSNLSYDNWIELRKIPEGAILPGVDIES
jgi:hypothetical protein